MDEKNDQPPMIRHYRRLAKTIIERHLGKPASRIVYKSSGRTNFVFAVNHVEGQFVVRISPNADNLNAFRKERWASLKAREAGVPSPEVLAVGNDAVSEPYMIMRLVTGSEATHHAKRRRIVNEVGRFAAIINSIKTNGFGANFDWNSDSSQKITTWSEYLDREYKVAERLEFFATQKILPQSELNKLSKIIEETKKADIAPSLNHSDLRLKNVIVDDDGHITSIIDWEECVSIIAPQWELSLALRDLSIDDKHAFIDGYGLRPEQVNQMAPLIKAFNILNYHGVVASAIEQNDAQKLAEIKLRLNGALDLFSLAC
jgi:hygromycin-B 4-O-kinase